MCWSRSTLTRTSWRCGDAELLSLIQGAVQFHVRCLVSSTAGGGGLSSDISNCGTNQPAQHGVDVCQQTEEAQRRLARGGFKVLLWTNEQKNDALKNISETQAVIFWLMFMCFRAGGDSSNQTLCWLKHDLNKSWIQGQTSGFYLATGTNYLTSGHVTGVSSVYPTECFLFYVWFDSTNRFHFGSLIVLILSFCVKMCLWKGKDGSSLWWPSGCFQSADATFLNLSEPLNCKSVLKSAIKTGHF